MRLFTCFAASLAVQVSGQLVPQQTYDPPDPSAGKIQSTSQPNSQWANVLGNALWFYDAQRSGKLDDGAYPNRVAWRNDSGLEDGSDWGIDLTGGWYDAGDYIKATFPLGFTLFALSWGALTHGEGYDLANQTAYLDSTLRWGFDWLMKAHPADDILYVQVGDGEVDNKYWGGDQNIPDPRPAYPINFSHPGTDAWASTSTAFSIASLLYTPDITYNATSTSSPPKSPSLADSSYASKLLAHAKTLYSTANQTKPYSMFGQSIPAVADAYAATNYTEKLAMAALSLALATNDSTYYADAYRYYQEFNLTGTNDPWNWDSRTPSMYVLWVEAAKTRPSLAEGAGLSVNLTGWQAEAEGWFNRILRGNLDEVYLTSGRLLYYDGWSRQNSLTPAMTAAMLFYKYAPMASSPDKTSQYENFAQTQVDYLMGKNPMNVSYLVGQHPNSPKNPHSAPASGGDNIKQIRNSPENETHILYGAVVGGPLHDDRFWDWRDDWVQTEVALDYNAVIPFLASWQLMNNASDPYYVNMTGTYTIPSDEPCDDALPCGGGSEGGGGLSKGAKAGIAVGVILGVGLIVAAICFWKRRTIAAWWRKGYMPPRV